MPIIESLLNRLGLQKITATVKEEVLPGERTPGDSEVGRRPGPEHALRHLYRRMWVDPALRQTIVDIRQMDRVDGRVKKIHGRMARTAIKGGLRIILEGKDDRKIVDRWNAFVRRLKLDRREKLESDARGLVMEGNLPMQWVLDPQRRVVAAVRMPTETILPQVGQTGLFDNPAEAYLQLDPMSGAPIAKFALWQLSLVRLSPDNYDDFGSLGRPYLDANRTVWRKLAMTEEDLVIRRRTRAPARFSHQLENATKEEFDAYKAAVENDKNEITTDFYIRGKGSVTAIQGDAQLDQIADVAHLLDTFYAGAPAPKGLFGYSGDLSRDILEDLKQDYFDEIDSLQDTLSYVYAMGFRLDLLLQGIHPDDHPFEIQFAERRTDTPNQRADLALKYQAMGASRASVFEAAGLDANRERELLEDEADDWDPYPGYLPEDDAGGPRTRVTVTPGNGRKGESATDVSTTRPTR